MLLSSVAETMFWSGRHIERAQALARAIRAVEGLSLDLPGGRPLGVRPLLPLVGLQARGAESPSVAIHALALDPENPASVLGALRAARKNLREARVVAPPELWVALNNQYQLLNGVADEPVPRVVDTLSNVLEIGSRIQGVLEGSMARDAAYSFMRIGVELERADMLLRVLAALLPALSRDGWERAFDDVRWTGLLSAFGVHAMYRRRHHYRTELATLLEFLAVDAASPRSVVYCLRVIEDQLCVLPRAAQVRAAVTTATTRAFTLSHATDEELAGRIDALLEALASVHTAIAICYFPDGPVREPREPSAAPAVLDPFEYLGREHAEVEAVLRVLDELAARAERAETVDRGEIAEIVAFCTDFGELGHHEKEELILMPRLVEIGFDWYDGPVASMRREHRHEHFFLRVLSEFAQQRHPWSAEDRRRFMTDAREFAHFMRAHMDHERRDLFEQAARSLSEDAKRKLAQAFADFDSKRQNGLDSARANVKALLEKYDSAPPWRAGRARKARAPRGLVP